MKKKFIILLGMLLLALPSFGIEESEIIREQSIQNRFDDIGTKILNANKVPRRVVFVYANADKKAKLKLDKTMSNRQVVLYNNTYKYTENDDELAAFIAREIVLAAKSYDGKFRGGLNTLQIKVSPKKYEIIADKLAVDSMVNAGYNPIGLITYINKSEPQHRFDGLSSKNLTSKRLAVIYEYIYTRYPYFLVNNEYLENEHYQNFLLTSQENRKRLMKKIKTGSTKRVKYE